MMLKLLFVGDGPRDEAAVPRLVERILAVPIAAEFEAWKELHLRGSGRGLGRKLLFMLRRARDRGAVGVVATVDADKSTVGDRLDDLHDAREKDRVTHATATAIGEAVPHLEAWLLDDDVAIRTTFQFASDKQIEAPTKVKSPKDRLNAYYHESKTDKTPVEALAEIAAHLEIVRCCRADQTGFKAFCEEVDRELRPLCGR